MNIFYRLFQRTKSVTVLAITNKFKNFPTIFNAAGLYLFFGLQEDEQDANQR